MTELDKHNQFEQQPIPPPRRDARERAKQAALREFDQQQATSDSFWQKLSKGLSSTGRPTDEPNRKEDSFMTRLTQKSYLMGAATACVAALGFVVLSPNWLPIDETSVQRGNQVPVPQLEKRQVVTPQAGVSPDAKVAQRALQTAPDSQHEVNDPVASITAQDSFAFLDQQRAEVLQRVQVAPKADVTPIPGYKEEGRDQFETTEESPLKLTIEHPVSTFSIDVDTASYSFVRRQLNSGVLPQKAAVRVEEMINYFDYNYPLPDSRDQPFLPTISVTDSLWSTGKKLVHIGIKGFDLEEKEKPRTNLVFLLDVSGSMNSPDKLPLVKQSMAMLLSSLNPADTVAIVVYAGAAGTVLEPTPAKDKQKILQAMNRLSAGGSTAGAQGIKQAYKLAESNFNKDAVNRVMLATDGDFNIGITNREELKGYIQRQRKKGIFLSVLGFGQGNYNDHLMQELAQNGNGVAAYIDTLSEAQKVLVQEAGSTLFPIAKDVKIQVEFNPATVAEYRLLGYETRALKREDFNNDAVDAGDIGAGHTVTAIYEITPVGSDARMVDESRYQKLSDKPDSSASEYGFFKLRYKLPNEDKSRLISKPIPVKNTELSDTLAREIIFSYAVAAFAQKLRGSKYINDFSYNQIIELAQQNKGEDTFGYRTEFVQMVRKANIAKNL